MDCENITRYPSPVRHLFDPSTGPVAGYDMLHRPHEECPAALEVAVQPYAENGHRGPISEYSDPFIPVPEIGVSLGLLVGCVCLLVFKRFGTRFD